MDKEQQENILINENDMLNSLLEAANFKDDKDFQKRIQVKRKDKILFEFNVRPLGEEEVLLCRKNATSYAPDPRGKNYPKIEKDFDASKYRSWKIYLATVDNDKKLLWDNRTIQNKLDVLQNINVIDKVLMSGEKETICGIIDEISGYGANMEDYIKN